MQAAQKKQAQIDLSSLKRVSCLRASGFQIETSNVDAVDLVIVRFFVNGPQSIKIALSDFNANQLIGSLGLALKQIKNTRSSKGGAL